jgi:uncharacterized protein
MKFIDPHIHMSVRVTDDYEAMKKAGYVAVVEPAFWAGSDKQYAQSFFDYFHHILTFEHNRAKKYGLYHYSFICINAKEARNPIAGEVVNGLEEYLDHENCLGVGEVGLDMITEAEINICREQIRICEKHNTLCIIHTPHVNKRVGVETLFTMLEEEKVDMNRYIMDHNNEETMEISRRYPDIYIGMTLYPTKVSIERAASLIKTYGSRRVMLNSSADWGKSYPLMVSEAGHKLQELGISKEDAEKVTFGNAFEFYSQSPKFRIE